MKFMCGCESSEKDRIVFDERDFYVCPKHRLRERGWASAKFGGPPVSSDLAAELRAIRRREIEQADVMAADPPAEIAALAYEQLAARGQL